MKVAVPTAEHIAVTAAVVVREVASLKPVCGSFFTGEYEYSAG